MLVARRIQILHHHRDLVVSVLRADGTEDLRDKVDGVEADHLSQIVVELYKVITTPKSTQKCYAPGC